MQSSELEAKKLPKENANLTLNSKKNIIHDKTKDIENYRSLLDELKVKFENKWNEDKKANANMQRENFEILRTLGIGAFGRVLLVKENKTSIFYAMKILDKSRLVKTKQVEHTRNEKKVLQSLDFPFLVSMKYFFMDNSYLYMILPFINGGELFTVLRRKGKFPEKLSQFYAAQILLALEYMHYCGLIHRDLKPENIVIDSDGYVKLTDFGFSKKIEGRTWTSCGTPEYMAPEIILSKGYGFASDWWSFGVLLFEMNAGHAPFSASGPKKIYDKITSGNYKLVSSFSTELKDIIKNLLQIDLTKRFGNLKNGIQDIKQHLWFRTIDWILIFNRKYKPGYVPICKDASDDSNFDYYEEQEYKVRSKNQYQNEFLDF